MFLLTQGILVASEEFYQDVLRFRIGTVSQDYTKIDTNVVRTEHTFYFLNEIKLKAKMFVAKTGISILRKIDAVIESDIYIGGDETVEGFLPTDVFLELINKFPKTAELRHYANARIASIVKEYFVETEVHELALKRFLDRRSNYVHRDITYHGRLVDLEKFRSLSVKLGELLNEAAGMDEGAWQTQVHDLIRMLYPKYILGSREIKIRGVDGYDKRPDFLLIDANGYVDVMEIKKPDVQLLTKQSSYRNNYVPVRELAGATQQIEKYIYCLNYWGEAGERHIKEKLSDKLPDGIYPKIVNPQGILILGRSNDFNNQQKSDFELIKRQYKHIADIMTYDDLRFRVKNIIKSLEVSLLK